MSSDSTKKRRVAADDIAVLSVAAGVEDIIAEMRSQMIHMQNEMDSMKGRLLQMDDLERKHQLQEEKLHNQEEKSKFLEDKCESLERSVKILIDEQQNWEYSAPDIPDTYWEEQGEEQGFDEDYIYAMGEFLECMKQITCELRSGNGYDDIELSDEHAIVLLHDDMLLPHWREFANAMQLYNRPIETVRVSSLQLTSFVLNLLAPALKQKQIKYLFLGNNEFVNIRDGIEFAVEAIKGNRQLKGFGLKLHWDENPINSFDDAQHLVQSIISHPLIEDVCLENCFRGGGIISYGILRSLLTSDKNSGEIQLARNNIRTEGDTAILDYLASNPPLKVLRLNGNSLNDDDARLIARALKHNSNLRKLYLTENNITDIGKSALGKAIYDPTSLNSLSDCNHTCYIDNALDNGCYNANTPKQNRKRKIYHRLSLRNREGSNVHHLNLEFGDEGEDEDSLALVPKVLESVNHYAEIRFCVPLFGCYVPPLSIMYEILRSWKMPELYERR